MRAPGRVSILPFLILSVMPLPLLPQLARVSIPVKVVIGGKPVQYPQGLQAFREDGVTMVPVRTTLAALGATVNWDEKSGTVAGERDCHSVLVREGDAMAQVDGTKLTMRRAAQAIDGELYAPLRPLAEGLSAQVAWDPDTQTAEVTPAADQAPGTQTLLTLTFRRPGTLLSPTAVRGLTGTANVNADTYRWVLNAADAPDLLTWTFLPNGGGPAQTFNITRIGGRLLAGSDTVDINAQIGQDLRSISALTFPAGSGSVSDLCQFPGLSKLTLQEGLAYSPDFLDAAIRRAPQLQSLTLTGSPELPVDISLPAQAQMPYRVETPHAVFLGDHSMSIRDLTRYATAFEQTAIPELAKDTELQPTRRKVVFQIYGDENVWNTATASLPVWGYFTGQEDRIYMAHWRTPETINTVLLYHEYFHWLAWEEGGVNLPTWLNEGLAHNLSWRVEAGTPDFSTPFARRQWLMVKGHPETPVPQLATYQKQDEYTITAVSYLLTTRGRPDLNQFFTLTRTGGDFAAAFKQAFGVEPAAFLQEYLNQVAVLRSSAG